MPVKERETEQVIVIPADTVYRYSTPVCSYGGSGQLLRAWVTAVTTPTSLRSFLIPPPPVGECSFGNWYVNSNTANSASWNACLSRSNSEPTEMTFLSSFSSLIGTTSKRKKRPKKPRLSKDSYRSPVFRAMRRKQLEARKTRIRGPKRTTNPCSHVKINDVVVSPGSVTTCRNWRYSLNSNSRAFEVHVSGSFVPPVFNHILTSYTGHHGILPVRSRKVSFGDVIDKIVNPFKNEYAQFMGEIASLGSLVESVSSKLKLLKSGIGGLRKAGKAFSSNPLGSARTAVNSAAGSFLEFKFGWEQAGEDVARIIAFTPYLKTHLTKLYQMDGKARRFSFPLSGSETKSYDYDSQTKVDITVTWKANTVVGTRATISGIKNSSKGIIADLQRVHTLYRLTEAYYGLNATPRRLWNVTPFTFLVDQVVPVADYLNDISSSQYNVQLSPSYVSDTYKEDATIVVTHSSGATMTFSRSYFKRTNSFLRLFSHRGFGTLFRASSITGALGAQTLTKGGKR